jgi:hypothetical protein
VRLAELLVFFGVDRVGLSEDLARDLLVVARRLRRGVGRDLGAVDGDHADPDQTRLGAERQHLAEQPGQRALVTLTKARDRRVIGRLTFGTSMVKKRGRRFEFGRGLWKAAA